MKENRIKSWRLPYSRDEYATAAQEYLMSLSLAKTGFYPIGVNELWHGGIHLNEDVIKALGGETLSSIAEGQVIAYRIDKVYQTADYGDFKAIFSSSFTLVRHQLEIPQPPQPLSSTASTLGETPENPAGEETGEDTESPRVLRRLVG